MLTISFFNKPSWVCLRIFAVVALVCGGALLIGCQSQTPTVELAFAPGSQDIVEGRQLVQGVAACGFCHGVTADPGSPLSGGRAFVDSFGEVQASNITPSNTGLAGWDTDDLLRLFRSFESKSGRKISSELHANYQWLSDRDIYRISSYLQSLEPVENLVEPRSVGFLARNTTGLFMSEPKVSGYVPDLSPRFALQRGRYLVHNVARCQLCHATPDGIFSSEVLFGSGGFAPIVGNEREVPNISGSVVAGIGTWDAEQLLKFLSTGATADGGFVDPASCPVGFFRNAARPDLEAMVSYLRSLPGEE